MNWVEAGFRTAICENLPVLIINRMLGMSVHKVRANKELEWFESL